MIDEKVCRLEEKWMTKMVDRRKRGIDERKDRRRMLGDEGDSEEGTGERKGPRRRMV